MKLIDGAWHDKPEDGEDLDRWLDEHGKTREQLSDTCARIAEALEPLRGTMCRCSVEVMDDTPMIPLRLKVEF